MAGDELAQYRTNDLKKVMTPALAIYPDFVDRNIDATIAILGGDLNRWRPHVKTTKLASVMRQLVRRGMQNFKCATTLELLCLCEVGARDVLVSYPMVGANAVRVRQIAEAHPDVRISAMVESREEIEQWRHSRVGLFIDVNPGMNRTGIEQDRVDEMVEVARELSTAGLQFRGLHYYDGQLRGLDLEERTRDAHRGYDRLLVVIDKMLEAGIAVVEVVTAGTPTLPCSAGYLGFTAKNILHRVSPGTVVYSDMATEELLAGRGYEPAAVVLARVVSQPSARRISCDAGHKALSVDQGVPNGRVLGHPEYVLGHPSEEHLPIDIPEGSAIPQIGDILYLAPHHVCTTVNNFDHALIVRNGEIEGVERVSARGRESPLLPAQLIVDERPGL